MYYYILILSMLKIVIVLGAPQEFSHSAPGHALVVDVHQDLRGLTLESVESYHMQSTKKIALMMNREGQLQAAEDAKACVQLLTAKTMRKRTFTAPQGARKDEEKDEKGCEGDVFGHPRRQGGRQQGDLPKAVVF